ncbi:MAG TPA: hypothetical protein VMG08_02955 [Allosphingosinicella sp.]|nr:hypothetical protein [Allosphingosinicella sp.]
MSLARNLAAVLLLAVLPATQAAAADPFVTVSPTADGSTGLAWWLLDMNSRPKGTTVAGITLAQINAALGAGEPRWCAADVLTPASFTSPDPAVRAEIAQSVTGPAGSIFSATTRMTGVPLTAVVGNYLACDGGVAPFVLLVQPAATGATLVYVRGYFGWTPFIAVRADANRLIVSSCLECDHAEILTYRAGRFSWRSENP